MIESESMINCNFLSTVNSQSIAAILNIGGYKERWELTQLACKNYHVALSL
jgi:hypothetical protein